MPACAKYLSKEGVLTTLPGNYEIYLSPEGKNLWTNYVVKLPEWQSWRQAEQKMYSIQLQQMASTTDLSAKFLAREKELRRTEMIMFDIANKWFLEGPVEK